MKHVALILSLFLMMVMPVQADQSETDSGLNLEMIMADPDWLGSRPLRGWFSDDGESVFYLSKRPGSNSRDLYRVPVAGGAAEKLSDSDWAEADSPDLAYNPRLGKKLFTRNSDVFVRDLVTGSLAQITRTAAREQNMQFAADGQRVLFRSGGNLFITEVGGGYRQYGDIREGEDPEQEAAARRDRYSFLNDQQRELFTSLTGDQNREEDRANTTKQRQLAAGDGAPLPIYLGKGREIAGLYPSPDGRHVIAVTRSDADNRAATEMPNYVTGDGYVVSEKVRSKVGTAPPLPQSLWLIDLVQAEVVSLELSSLKGMDEDPFKKMRKEATAWHKARGATDSWLEAELTAPDSRGVTVQTVSWSPDGDLAAVSLHAIDNKDRWLVSVAPEEAALNLEHRLTRKGWINWSHNEFGWTRDNDLWFLSDESGHSHLYLKSRDERRAEALTSGDFIVESPQLSHDGKDIFFAANRDDPSVYHIYGLRLADRELRQMTNIYSHSGARQSWPAMALSRDGKWLLFEHSRMNHPPELYIQPVNEPSAIRRLTRTVSDEFAGREWPEPELVDVPSTHFDGVIRSRLYLPANPPPGPMPAVVFVHGAGYLQNAHAGWSGYFREYMFHVLLNEHGVAVLDMDYRGSRGYGADWREAIYRQMGHPELEDLLDGVAHLVNQHGVDRDRIGVYGGSYGGFMTFMAMFRAPGIFAAGASLRPVTDWAHYNHGYTSNILNTPALDPEAYVKSSPIYYAENYDSRPMLIAHGMQDDNVHFQDSVRLVQRLIELKKENFEMAIYPLDPHGFKYPESWLDEYRRIFKLFRENLSFPNN